MNEELSILYKVQEADTEIARRQKALDSLDTGAELESEIGTLQAELAELRTTQHAAEEENLDRELELKTVEEKKDRFQRQLYSGTVSNPRQLSDLHREVEMLGREIRKVEDRMLELMETLESQRSEIAARERRLAELTEALESVRGTYETKSKRLQGEIEELGSRRKEYASQVRAQLLKRYEQIRARAGNQGLVKVTGRDCPGCRIGLPSETVKQVKAGKVGMTCDNCGRLLIWGDEGREGGGAGEEG